MKTLLLSSVLAVTLSGCAGFTDRLPHYLAIADSALENSEPQTETTEADVAVEAE